MRAIIQAAGSGTRWGNYTGVRKHEVVIDGERLIDRTTRLLKEHDVDDILLLVDPEHPYEVAGAHTVFQPRRETSCDGAQLFLAGRRYWSRQAPTLLLWGDVWFSEPAIGVMTQPRYDWTHFHRLAPSKLTGKAWPEGWGAVFPPDQHQELIDECSRVIRAAEAGLITHTAWPVYMAMQGAPEEKLGRWPHEIMGSKWFRMAATIDDWTEDFDFPSDLDNWLRLRREAGL